VWIWLVFYECWRGETEGGEGRRGCAGRETGLEIISEKHAILKRVYLPGVGIPNYMYTFLFPLFGKIRFLVL